MRMPLAAVAGLTMTLMVSLVVVVGFSVSVRTRVRDLSHQFPKAVVVPITVGRELAGVSERAASAFDGAGPRLRTASFAALAFDAEGMHVATSWDELGLIPADRVTVTGYGRSVLGLREMKSLELRITTDAGDLDFAFVPMRLKGNPIFELTDDEFDDVSARLIGALRGEPVPPGWPY